MKILKYILLSLGMIALGVGFFGSIYLENGNTNNIWWSCEANERENDPEIMRCTVNGGYEAIVGMSLTNMSLIGLGLIGASIAVGQGIQPKESPARYQAPHPGQAPQPGRPQPHPGQQPPPGYPQGPPR
ncbi:hypothetical protein NE857_23885 [Nocardiopsis exhalans]|uniref:Uncharacterized protein n=1 Tax=Nocardiopsis exhalans TaxID=163604 RepID=A0ABY5D1V2_9ACTN|nr:hypothetical protein [Nocardiopsis exhalans]USY18334.1 hypothetical protein NE857_23885 [Nocardiopsis exhalans]